MKDFDTISAVVYSLSHLCLSMQKRSVVSLFSGGQFYDGIINGISVEDGSGRHYLIKLHNKKEQIYVRAE